jgi:hypothetical protein
MEVKDDFLINFMGAVIAYKILNEIEEINFQGVVLNGLYKIHLCKKYNQHDLKARKVSNPMVYECLNCGKILKSKKNEKRTK